MLVNIHKIETLEDAKRAAAYYQDAFAQMLARCLSVVAENDRLREKNDALESDNHRYFKQIDRLKAAQKKRKSPSKRK